MAIARYERPRTLREACQLLAGDAGPALRPLAGGTDLHAAHVGRPLGESLLDLSGIAELRGIREEADAWLLGATTTWTDVLRAELPPLFDGLKAAAREVGGVQVQNAGTLAGNVCNASPAADGMPALLALDAQVLLASAVGERRLPLAEFVLGPRRTARRPDELVTGLRVPKRGPDARSAFLKLGGRRYLVISIAMVAVVVDVDGEGACTHAAVAVGSCAPVARRLPSLETRLVGLAPADWADALQAADLAPLAPIDDVRASAGYRLDAVATLVRRALQSVADGGPGLSADPAGALRRDDTARTLRRNDTARALRVRMT